MIELKFDKTDIEYQIDIKLTSRTEDSIPMVLDSGSPISTICIQNLILITRESKVSLIKKIERAVDEENVIEFGVYGSQEHKIKRKFTPYIIKDMVVGGQRIPYFLMWLDITNYMHRNEITSTLFGFDNLKYGKKWFDDNDDFHIMADSHFNLDIAGLKGAITNFGDNITSIKEISELQNSIVCD